MKTRTIRMTLAAALLLLTEPLSAGDHGHDIKYVGGKIMMDFRTAATLGRAPYSVRRSKGRYGDYREVKSVTNGLYEEAVEGNPNDYYYMIYDARGRVLDTLALELELFGRDVHIYRPTDNIDSIASDMARVYGNLSGREFGRERRAMLFHAGDYRGAGAVKVPCYLHVAGLGRTPFEVQVAGIETPPNTEGGKVADSRCRSVENLAVMGAPEGGWVVSQAASMRRVYSESAVRHGEESGVGSGGYLADCWFGVAMGANSRSEWYIRNSQLDRGRGEQADASGNSCFQGVMLGAEMPAESLRDDWETGGSTTVVALTPKIREKPFLFVDEEGRYKIFRPALRHNAAGVSYSRTAMGDGEVIDVAEECFVVKPGTNAAEINVMAGLGKHLIFMPGLHEIEEPIEINKPGMIVMGIGWATITPGAANGRTAIAVGDVDGVTVASLLFDAHYDSQTLISVGSGERNETNHSADPTLLADLFFRSGGFLPATMSVGSAVEITANDVIGDHIWAWRADHGVKYSMGWTTNMARNGLVVKGDYVSMYGLFAENFQGYQTLWEGDCGRMFFYRSQTPHDPSVQSRYMSEKSSKDGYAAYKVADGVTRHEAVALGIYDKLVNEIAVENSVEVPDCKGVGVFHLSNTSLSNGGRRGFRNVINGQVKSTFNTARDHMVAVKEFKGKK